MLAIHTAGSQMIDQAHHDQVVSQVLLVMIGQQTGL